MLVHDRKPCQSLGIEPTRSNQFQLVALGLASIKCIHIEDHPDWRCASLPDVSADELQTITQGRVDRLKTSASKTGQLGNPPVRDSLLKLFKRFEMQLPMEPPRQAGPDSGHCHHQGFGIELPSELVKGTPSAGCGHFGDCRRNSCADCGQGDEAFTTFFGQDRIDGPFQQFNHIRSVQVCARAKAPFPLQVQQVPHFPESMSNTEVQAMGHGALPLFGRSSRIAPRAALILRNNLSGALRHGLRAG